MFTALMIRAALRCLRRAIFDYAARATERDRGDDGASSDAASERFDIYAGLRRMPMMTYDGAAASAVRC